MNEAEATARAQELQDNHPDRDRFTWLARPSAGDTWEVVRVAISPAGSTPTGESTPTDTVIKPDPRTVYERHVGGNWTWHP